MIDIVFTPQNNPGGVLLLEVAMAPGIDQFPARTADGTVSLTGLTFRPNFRWFGLYGTEGTKRFEEPGKDSDNGTTYQPQIRCFIPGDSKEVRKTLHDWMQYPLVVKVEDNAGSARLVGTKVEYLRLEVNFDTQDQMGGRRGTEMVFTGVTTQSAAYLN